MPGTMLGPTAVMLLAVTRQSSPSCVWVRASAAKIDRADLVDDSSMDEDDPLQQCDLWASAHLGSGTRSARTTSSLEGPWRRWCPRRLVSATPRVEPLQPWADLRYESLVEHQNKCIGAWTSELDMWRACNRIRPTRMSSCGGDEVLTQSALCKDLDKISGAVNALYHEVLDEIANIDRRIVSLENSIEKVDEKVEHLHNDVVSLLPMVNELLVSSMKDWIAKLMDQVSVISKTIAADCAARIDELKSRVEALVDIHICAGTLSTALGGADDAADDLGDVQPECPEYLSLDSPVRLIGLQWGELNGKCGMISDIISSSGRFGVHIFGEMGLGPARAFLPKNLGRYMPHPNDLCRQCCAQLNLFSWPPCFCAPCWPWSFSHSWWSVLTMQ